MRHLQFEHSLDDGNHQHVALGELLVQDVPLVAVVVVPGPRRGDVGVDVSGVHAGLDELTALHIGVAAGVPGLLVPAGADVAICAHEPSIPFFARASQGGSVSIFASGENRAIFAAHNIPASAGTPVPAAWSSLRTQDLSRGHPGADAVLRYLPGLPNGPVAGVSVLLVV